MASFSIHDGDDDDFDWEAAVKAIDIACEKTVGASTSKPHQIGKRPNPGGGQSTLDKFFSNPILSKHVTPPKEVVVEEELGFDEEVSNCVKIDREAALTWIYPVNIPLRDYQLSITRTALFSNTLVALPTGLGKTLIAAVVIYNYFRWFPEGKIVFAAPSRPLVMQQIEACHNIVGIPQEWTIDMTGQTSPATRACYWKAKRVFFVTPQVLEKDIQSGSCLLKHLVCLVIDEAHRASGNYSYCVAVRELMAVPVQLRILALTATPGSKQQTIQQIIDNLQISILEYRNENDHDVTPYVHDRKIELIEVPMGQDALQVNNLLLEVIRPFVARLSAIGVLQKRDLQTLSPCDLLNSRDKFRQAPPQDLHQLKYGEVEGYFGVLITLYHIRKLLSSHGIRPAFEMLEEKLKQGSFSRFMSRNEVLWKAKLLMQQTLSHGDLSPKFSKMLEVLVEHFKTKDSRSSRVIIFSNFRGSVRDIMNALANIGEYVTATEFIGQSSGKTSKGQSQKVQQAVLEKFRAGGYNVIVATSIGEEGLDIMEVDLVICFDANVSPLRMIQRMGRTGRKHEGRVVVLACEGSELKGYMRKQANGKAIKKHMRNGGMNSFHFHSSPRMVPHVFRPEVRFIKLSIEQFVPRGKKVKDDDTIQTTLFNCKLTETEIDLVAKYFHPSGDDKWRASLIAFPHFQAYPSRVHEVVHSIRTGILIDTMQHLQGLSFSRDSKDFDFEDEAASERCLRAGIEQSGCSPEGLQLSHEVSAGDLKRQESETNDLFQMENTRNKDHCTPHSGGQCPPIHSFLFGSDFVSVDLLGRIIVVSVPVLPPSKVYHTKFSNPSSTLFLNCFMEDYVHLKDSLGQSEGISMKVKGVPPFKTGSLGSKDLRPNSLHCPDGLQEKTQAGTEWNFQTQRGGNNTKETAGRSTTMLLLADEFSADLKDVDLSPRVTNFIECGVVPESPIDIGILRSRDKGEFMVVHQDTPSKLHSELHPKLSVPIINDEGRKDRTPSRGDTAEIRTPVLDLGKSSSGRSISDSKVVVGIQTPPNLSSTSCSKDWALSSGGKSESVEQEHKFKRLFKYGDSNRRPFQANEEKFGTTETKAKSGGRTNLCAYKHDRGERNLVDDVKTFIEEEAEVSSQVAVSDDEEYEQEINSFEDSFIDDGINFTVTSSQTEATPTDMMAIYRRSLLSQSPWGEKLDSSVEISSNSVVPKSTIHVCGSSVGTSNHSPHTPQTGFDSTAGNPSTKLNSQTISSEGMPITPNGFSKENSSTIESRKRKSSFIPHGSLPIHNLKQDFMFNSEDASKGSFLQDQDRNTEVGRFVFDDDQFYEGIDFDALEEQAAKLLRSKPESSVHNQSVIPEPIPQNLNIPGSPSFDLGI